MAESLKLGSEATLAPGESSLPLDLTDNELMVRYWSFVENYYVRRRLPLSEHKNIKDALRRV